MNTSRFPAHGLYSHESSISLLALVVAVLLLILSIIPIANAQSPQKESQQARFTMGRPDIPLRTIGILADRQKPTAPPVQQCNRTESSVPSEVDLGTEALGLTQVIDSPSYYRIYGFTAKDINDQLRHCGPVELGIPTTLTAQTSYSLTWQYRIEALGDGTCGLHNVQIGLHVASILPEWQPSPYATKGLADRWQTFTHALERHEQGHRELDIEYATQLTKDLQTMPNAACDTLGPSAEAVVRVDTSALDIANQMYDTETGHGATQGAIAPRY